MDEKVHVTTGNTLQKRMQRRIAHGAQRMAHSAWRREH